MAKKNKPLPCPFCGHSAIKHPSMDEYGCPTKACQGGYHWATLEQWNKRAFNPDIAQLTKQFADSLKAQQDAHEKELGKYKAVIVAAKILQLDFEHNGGVNSATILNACKESARNLMNVLNELGKGE